MKIKLWGVYQAVQLKEIGLKMTGTSFNGHDYWQMAIFPSKKDAKEYLTGVVIDVLRGQENGSRSKTNLVPSAVGGLDFKILEVSVECDDDQLKKKGWLI